MPNRPQRRGRSGRGSERRRRSDAARSEQRAEGAPESAASPADETQPAEPAPREEPSAQPAQPARRAERRDQRRGRGRGRGGSRASGGSGLTLSSATPWVAAGVAATVVIVILAVFLTTGGGSGGAQFGDHWHASLNISVCGGPNYTIPEPRILPGLHSHSDNVIHIEPRRPGESGGNASLDTFFESNGLRVEADLIAIPGDPVIRNGEPCDDGEPGRLRVLVNGSEVPEFLSYLPQDGDRIELIFD